MTATLAPPRVDAFRQLGTDVSESGSAHQALVTAGIAGMDVRKVELTTPSGRPVLGQYALEDASGEPLPNITVGEAFTVVQFEQVAATLDAVAAFTDATFECAGTLDTRALGIGGARAYVSMLLPGQISIGGVDAVRARIVAFMNHGGASNVLAPTAIRVVCANQQPQVAGQDEFKIIIRHTTSAPERTANAERALTATVASMRQMEIEAEQMLDIVVTDELFRAIMEEVFPMGGDSKATLTRHERRLALLEHIHHSPTQDTIANTAWGAYQAVLEYGEWHQQVRNAEGGFADARARRVLTSSTMAQRQMGVYRTIRELVGLG